MITVTIVSIALVCGGIWDDPSGLIKSPNFPSPYPANKECVYVVALDAGKAIQLDFLVFDVEGDTNCLFDYVEVTSLLFSSLSISQSSMASLVFPVDFSIHSIFESLKPENCSFDP